MNKYIMETINYDESVKFDAHENWWKNGLIGAQACFYPERILKNLFVLFFNAMI